MHRLTVAEISSASTKCMEPTGRKRISPGLKMTRICAYALWVLARWPVEVAANWVQRVNQADDGRELEALRRCVQRGRPYGRMEWQKEIAKRLGLESAYRPAGRPRKVGTDHADTRD